MQFGGRVRLPGLVAASLLVGCLTACSGSFSVAFGDASPSVTASAAPVSVEPTQTATPSADTRVSEEQLAQSVVRVVRLTPDDDICGWGSGSVVGDGLVLTNFHVVQYNRFCPADRLGLETLADDADTPRLQYIADVVAYDARLDLAVLRLAEAVDGAEWPAQLPSVVTAPLDSVDLGDPLTILGYPALGGETITTTHGYVSGFRDDGAVQRGWIKTDATITGGNSGGLVVNANGEMIGIPTQASASDAGDVTDCRVTQDTNGDGTVDDQDQCVSLGGFLNLLRPASFALDLIEEAEQADPIPLDDVVDDTDEPDDEPTIGDPLWGTGFEDGELVNKVEDGDDLPADADQVCALLTYSNMIQGMTWSYQWIHEGSPVESEAASGLTWTGEADGRGALCAGVANGKPVKNGGWGLEIHFNDNPEPAFLGGVLVGE